MEIRTTIVQNTCLPFEILVCDPCKSLTQIVKITCKCSEMMNSKEKLQDQLESKKIIIPEMVLDIKDIDIYVKK